MWEKLYDLKRPVSDFLVGSERLEDSHQRCRAAGLSCEFSRLNQDLNGFELNGFFARYLALGTYSRLLFSGIYRDLSDCNCVFILTDDAARLITLYAHPKILDDAMEEMEFCPGVLLTEERCGTNAVALALRFHEPAITRGEQHYCRLFHGCCIVAAPVMGANRRPVACVAISSRHDVALAEKLALVNFIVKDIERFHYAAVDVPKAVCNGTPASYLPHAADFTPRQRQVLTLFATGLSYKQIARQLGIGSARTVEQHLDVVRTKLHVTYRRECIQKAIALGLLEMAPPV